MKRNTPKREDVNFWWLANKRDTGKLRTSTDTNRERRGAAFKRHLLDKMQGKKTS